MLPDVPVPPAATSSDTASLTADAARTEALKPAILEAIQTVYDPEIPVNIWELGLIYEVIVDAGNVAGEEEAGNVREFTQAENRAVDDIFRRVIAAHGVEGDLHAAGAVFM